MIESLLPVAMFAVLGILLFSGYPVALVLGGIGLGFGAIGYLLGDFLPIEFFNIAPRIWAGIAENLILDRGSDVHPHGHDVRTTGFAEDLLRCLQLLLRRVPGGLAFSVILLGTILAAMTGIIGASVVMMSVMALPMMMARSYSAPNWPPARSRRQARSASSSRPASCW